MISLKQMNQELNKRRRQKRYGQAVVPGTHTGSSGKGNLSRWEHSYRKEKKTKSRAKKLTFQLFVPLLVDFALYSYLEEGRFSPILLKDVPGFSLRRVGIRFFPITLGVRRHWHLVNKRVKNIIRSRVFTPQRRGQLLSSMRLGRKSVT